MTSKNPEAMSSSSGGCIQSRSLTTARSLQLNFTFRLRFPVMHGKSVNVTVQLVTLTAAIPSNPVPSPRPRHFPVEVGSRYDDVDKLCNDERRLARRNEAPHVL